jgi:hypothetical protein
MVSISKPFQQVLESERGGESHVFAKFEVCLSGTGFGVFGLRPHGVQEGSADNAVGHSHTPRRIPW